MPENFPHRYLIAILSPSVFPIPSSTSIDTMSDPISSVAGIFFALTGLLFAGVGGYFIVHGIRRMILARLSRNWMVTEGTIITSQLHIPSRTSEDAGGSSIVRSTGFGYRPDITYEYVVRGDTLQSSMVTFAGHDSRKPGPAQKMVSRYTPGMRVEVHYDPMKPERAVLEPGKGKGNTGVLITGAGVAAFGLFFAYVGIFGFDALFRLMDKDAFERTIPIAGIVAGVLLVISGIVSIIRSRRSRKWPVAQGRVVSSKILEDWESSDSSTTSRMSSYTYKPEIVFEYDVDGTTHVSNMVSMVDYQSSNFSRSEKIMERYPEGKDVQVFYHPSNPSLGILEPRSIGGGCLILAIGLGFIVICTLVALLQNARLAPMM